MDELIDRIAQNVGLNRDVAKQAVSIILNFLRKEGPADSVNALFADLPGAEALAREADEQQGGTGILGNFGSGVMAVMGQLQGLGLGMGEIQSVTQETVNYAKQEAGEDKVNEVITAIPGVSQFV